ncbi:hypothetical protein D3C74_363150 [compost metagenome]
MFISIVYARDTQLGNAVSKSPPFGALAIGWRRRYEETKRGSNPWVAALVAVHYYRRLHGRIFSDYADLQNNRPSVRASIVYTLRTPVTCRFSV